MMGFQDAGTRSFCHRNGEGRSLARRRLAVVSTATAAMVIALSLAAVMMGLVTKSSPSSERGKLRRLLLAENAGEAGEEYGTLLVEPLLESASRKLKGFFNVKAESPQVTITSIGISETIRRGTGAQGVWGDGKDHDRCFDDPTDPSKQIRRCRANVYFFGVSKCGTTSLAKWMREHPDLRWSSNVDNLRKPSEAHVLEVSPGDWERIKSQGRYGRWGVTAPSAEEQDAVVDYTPHYATLPEVPYRIAERYGFTSIDGSTKFLVMLREPVSRTISSWQFKTYVEDVDVRRAGSRTRPHDRRSLKDVVEMGQKQVQLLVNCRERALQKLRSWSKGAIMAFAGMREIDLRVCNPANFLGPSLYLAHIGKSAYALQLDRWFTLFGRQNIKVLFLEEIMSDPMATLDEVFDWLEIDMMDSTREDVPNREAWEKTVMRKHNQTGRRKKEILDEEVTPELVEEMRRFFAPHNSALQRMLGRPLPANWSTVEDYE